MIKLLTRNDYTPAELEADKVGNTKYFQHITMRRILEAENSRKNFCEIGTKLFFDVLTSQAHAPLYVVDPYKGGPGAGVDGIPDSLPYPVGLFRCLIGVDSQVIPSELFDLSFSMSVIEHVGQKAARYDCNPTDHSPAEQEAERNAFCRELFRTMRPGGVTWHTVDHAARNLSFVKNFTESGFELIEAQHRPTVEDCLHSSEAIRQGFAWGNVDLPMPEEQRKLHAVLLMGFRRPV